MLELGLRPNTCGCVHFLCQARDLHVFKTASKSFQRHGVAVVKDTRLGDREFVAADGFRQRDNRHRCRESTNGFASASTVPIGATRVALSKAGGPRWRRTSRCGQTCPPYGRQKLPDWYISQKRKREFQEALSEAEGCFFNSGTMAATWCAVLRLWTPRQNFQKSLRNRKCRILSTCKRRSCM